MLKTGTDDRSGENEGWMRQIPSTYFDGRSNGIVGNESHQHPRCTRMNSITISDWQARSSSNVSKGHELERTVVLTDASDPFD